MYMYLVGLLQCTYVLPSNSCSYDMICFYLYHWQCLWKKRLTRYFQNGRSRRDNTLRIIISRKRKPVKSTTALSKTALSVPQNRYGVAHYLPQRRDRGDNSVDGQTDADWTSQVESESGTHQWNDGHYVCRQTTHDRSWQIVTGRHSGTVSVFVCRAWGKLDIVYSRYFAAVLDWIIWLSVKIEKWGTWP